MAEARAALIDSPSPGLVPQYTAPIADSNIPRNVTMVMPQLVKQVQEVAPNPQPQLTPADLLKPLPSIVNTEPVQLPTCSGISEWVDQNPMMAVGVLGVLAYFVFGMGKGGGK